jgi:hypothetical protein
MDDASPRRLEEEPAVTSESRANQSDLRPSDLPDPNDLPELRIFSRSTIFFWWPVWLTGYILAAITYFWGETLSVSNGTNILVHPNTGLGITFIVVLSLIMMFTNVRLRGIYSVVGLLVIALVTVLFAWLGWWDSIFRIHSPAHRLYELRLLRHVLHAPLGDLGLEVLFLRSPCILAGQARAAYRRTHDRRR